MRNELGRPGWGALFRFCRGRTHECPEMSRCRERACLACATHYRPRAGDQGHAHPAGTDADDRAGIREPLARRFVAAIAEALARWALPDRAAQPRERPRAL